MTTAQPEISAIIPVYKNRDTLTELYHRLSVVFAARFAEFELVFVDDTCPQESLTLLTELANQDPHVTVIGMAQNVGQQHAVLTGMQHARGKLIAILDADLQDPPEAVPSLIDKAMGDFDVVFAGRAGKYQIGHRLLTSRLYKWALHILTGVPKDAGLFMVANRSVTDRLIAMPVDNPHLVAMIGALDVKMASIPVKRNIRPSGASAYTSWMRLKVGLGAAFWAFHWQLGLRSKAHQAPRKFPVKIKLLSRYNLEDQHVNKPGL